MLTEEQAAAYLLKHVDELTDEQLHIFVTQFIAALKRIREMTQQLADWETKLNNQEELIKQLSFDNLKLVAKLDELTGKQPPGTGFAA